MKRFPWMLTVLTTAAIALLIGLGVWQVQRLRWKEGLIAKAEAASPARPNRWTPCWPAATWSSARP